MKRYLQTEAGTFVENQGWLGGNTLGTGASTADYDGDGDLDVYITRYAQPNTLLENRGGGRFVDVTAQAGVDAGRYRSMSSAWGDLDRDGDLDLFVGNYGWFDESGETETESFGPADPSVLYINEGDGTFRDASDLLPKRSPRVHLCGGLVRPERGRLVGPARGHSASLTPTSCFERRGDAGRRPRRVRAGPADDGEGLAVADLNGDGFKIC